MASETRVPSEQPPRYQKRESHWVARVVLRSIGIVVSALALGAMVAIILYQPTSIIIYIFYAIPIVLSCVQHGISLSRLRHDLGPLKRSVDVTLEVCSMLCWLGYLAFDLVLLVLESVWFEESFGGYWVSLLLLAIFSLIATVIHINFLIMGCVDKRKMPRTTLATGATTFPNGVESYQARSEICEKAEFIVANAAVFDRATPGMGEETEIVMPKSALLDRRF